jgi:hypothetical protein
MSEPTLATAEDVLARLTSAAYQVALRHGLHSPFIDVELDMWRALRFVLASQPKRVHEVGERWPGN